MQKNQTSKNLKSIPKPTPSSEAAYARMKAAKSRNTIPEKALRSKLHRKGLRFRLDQKPIANINRRADIIFRPARIAVFIDGCFWHGCPVHGTQSKSNGEYWEKKIKQNQDRDIDTTNRLKAAGWKVIRVWEHEDLEEASQRIFNSVLDYYKKRIKTQR